jgi:hypothetical protein
VEIDDPDFQSLSAVSCASVSFCMAIDAYFGDAVIYDGTSWSAPQPLPDNIDVISCPAPGFCAGTNADGDAYTFTAPQTPPASGTPPPAHAVTAVAKPANGSPPTVLGTPVVGNVLKATPGSWQGSGPLSYAYQWQTCAHQCVAVGGGTGSSLKLGSGEVGERVRVLVTATNAGGATPAASGVTSPVAQTGAFVRAALRRIAAIPRALDLSGLLAHGGYTTRFTAPEAGRLVVGWYLSPGAGRRSHAKHTPVLIASARVSCAAAGSRRVRIALTRAGREQAARARSLKAAIDVSFTPSAGVTVSVAGTHLFRAKR